MNPTDSVSFSHDALDLLPKPPVGIGHPGCPIGIGPGPVFPPGPPVGPPILKPEPDPGIAVGPAPVFPPSPPVGPPIAKPKPDPGIAVGPRPVFPHPWPFPCGPERPIRL